MLQDILWYDRQGFVPSTDKMSLEEYVSESEAKLKLRQEFERDPSRFVSKHIGKDVQGELLLADEKTSKKFRDMFETEPFPGILCSPEVYKQIPQHHSFISALSSLRKSNGTVLWFNHGGTGLSIPIVRTMKRNEELSDKMDYSSVLGHEMVHAVRYQVFRNRMIFQRTSTEETVAYLFQEIFLGDTLSTYMQEARLFPMMYEILTRLPHYGIATGILATTYVLSASPGKGIDAFLTTLASSIAVFACSTGLAHYGGMQAASFFNRCAQEGINPGYVYLRSSPGEFSSKKPIAEQLATSEKTRFQIMAYQLGMKEWQG